jgi:hypothetical protein
VKNGRTPLLVGCSFGELVEYVEVALVAYLTNYTALLEEVVGDLRTHGLAMVVEHDLKVFTLEHWGVNEE